MDRPRTSDSRVINLAGAPALALRRCRRGQAENPIKAHELHLASNVVHQRPATSSAW